MQKTKWTVCITVTHLITVLAHGQFTYWYMLLTFIKKKKKKEQRQELLWIAIITTFELSLS